MSIDAVHHFNLPDAVIQVQTDVSNGRLTQARARVALLRKPRREAKASSLARLERTLASDPLTPWRNHVLLVVRRAFSCIGSWTHWIATPSPSSRMNHLDNKRPPRPENGVTKHCWGRRRRREKKIAKGMWKVLRRLGVLDRIPIETLDCSWERDYKGHALTIHVWAPGFDDWDCYPLINHAYDRLHEPIWETHRHTPFQPIRLPRVDDARVLQLLRREIQNRKRARRNRPAPPRPCTSA